MSAPAVRTERVHAGSYRYHLGGHVVRVDDRDPNPAFGDTGRMWMAIAEWDERYSHSDPMPTKREAKKYALAMLARRVELRGLTD